MDAPPSARPTSPSACRRSRRGIGARAAQASIFHRGPHPLGHVGGGRVPVERHHPRANGGSSPSARRASPSARGGRGNGPRAAGAGTGRRRRATRSASPAPGLSCRLLARTTGGGCWGLAPGIGWREEPTPGAGTREAARCAARRCYRPHRVRRLLARRSAVRQGERAEDAG